jgi:hypothetical protein
MGIDHLIVTSSLIQALLNTAPMYQAHEPECTSPRLLLQGDAKHLVLPPPPTSRVTIKRPGHRASVRCKCRPPVPPHPPIPPLFPIPLPPPPRLSSSTRAAPSPRGLHLPLTLPLHVPFHNLQLHLPPPRPFPLLFPHLPQRSSTESFLLLPPWRNIPSPTCMPTPIPTPPPPQAPMPTGGARSLCPLIPPRTPP